MLYPTITYGLSFAKRFNCLPEGSYVKSVKYYMGDDRLARYLLDDARFWAQLESSLHYNIGRFRGCVLLDQGCPRVFWQITIN